MILQVYAPQQGRPVKERDFSFFHELQDVKNRLPYGHNAVTLGDLNGHMGQERAGKQHVISAFSVER